MAENAVGRVKRALSTFCARTANLTLEGMQNTEALLSTWSDSLQKVVHQLNITHSIKKNCSPFEAFCGWEDKSAFAIHKFLQDPKTLKVKEHDNLIEQIHKVNWLVPSKLLIARKSRPRYASHSHFDLYVSPRHTNTVVRKIFVSQKKFDKRKILVGHTIFQVGNLDRHGSWSFVHQNIVCLDLNSEKSRKNWRDLSQSKEEGQSELDSGRFSLCQIGRQTY